MEFDCLNKVLDKMNSTRFNTDVLSEVEFKFFNALKPCADHEKAECDDKKRKMLADAIKENEMYKQMMIYYNWLKTEGAKANDDIAYVNDKVLKLFNDITECVIASDADKKRFAKAIGNISSKGSIQMYLAGHIHAYGHPDEVDGYVPAGQKCIFVSGKFYNETDKNICGYLLEIDRSDIDKQTVKYKMIENR